MSFTPLVFIRHGETDWNRALRFQGQRDIPLNDLGRRQAARNGRAVAGILARSEWRLVASPLSRAVETMEIVLTEAGQAGRRFDTDPVLMEVRYGEWEGLTIGEIAQSRPDEAKAREADKWAYAPPGGEKLCAFGRARRGMAENAQRPDLRRRPWRRSARTLASSGGAPRPRRAASCRAAGPGDAVHARNRVDDLTNSLSRPSYSRAAMSPAPHR